MGVVAYGSWAEARLRAIDVLFEQSSWADVVRESQEVVELALKGLLRAHGVQPPRIHDVSEVLLAERSRLPEPLQAEIGSLAEGSRRLRRDRELAFYGAEDLTPSGFYTKQDADEAMGIAHRTVSLVRPHVSGPASRRRHRCLCPPFLYERRTQDRRHITGAKNRDRHRLLEQTVPIPSITVRQAGQ